MNIVGTTAALVFCLLLLPQWALGSANHRGSLDRKEKAAQEWQSGQNQKLRIIDREAERLIGVLSPASTQKCPSAGKDRGR
jgi:hypothetical protein